VEVVGVLETRLADKDEIPTFVLGRFDPGQAPPVIVQKLFKTKVVFY